MKYLAADALNRGKSVQEVVPGVSKVEDEKKKGHRSEFGSLGADEVSTDRVPHLVGEKEATTSSRVGPGGVHYLPEEAAVDVGLEEEKRVVGGHRRGLVVENLEEKVLVFADDEDQGLPRGLERQLVWK